MSQYFWYYGLFLFNSQITVFMTLPGILTVWYDRLLHTYTVMRPDNAFSALYNNTEQRANIRAKTQYLVFARILSFCPHTAFRPSPGFATYREWSMGERRLQSTYIASDYYIVTSYLNAINLLNYNDICLYKQYAILCQQNVSAIRWSY